MPLCCSQTLDPNISQTFRWSPAGFLYLGIKVSPCLKDLYKLNIAPLLHTVKQDLDRWCGLPLSLLGRIHLIKMNILPRLLYFFQMLPLVLSKKVFTKLNSAIISFMWRKKRPRLRYSFLCLPIKKGGLAAPSFTSYLWSAQFKFLLEWFIGDPNSVWLGCESASLGRVPLQNVLYVSPGRVSALIKDNVLLQNMLNIWRGVRKMEGYSNCFSLLTPIHEKHKGIKVVGDMIQGGSILSFQQVKSKYGITNRDFFKCVQVCNFILCKLKDCLFLP